jgi:ketosteroid isomerase-like protein
MMTVSKGVAAPDERVADENTLRDADSRWSKAASARDLSRTLSYDADDATLLPPNAPLVNGKDACCREWADLLAGFSGTLRGQATKVDISGGGDWVTSSVHMRARGRRRAVSQKKIAASTWRSGKSSPTANGTRGRHV